MFMDSPKLQPISKGKPKPAEQVQKPSVPSNNNDSSTSSSSGCSSNSSNAASVGGAEGPPQSSNQCNKSQSSGNASYAANYDTNKYKNNNSYYRRNYHKKYNSYKYGDRHLKEYQHNLSYQPLSHRKFSTYQRAKREDYSSDWDGEYNRSSRNHSRHNSHSSYSKSDFSNSNCEDSAECKRRFFEDNRPWPQQPLRHRQQSHPSPNAELDKTNSKRLVEGNRDKTKPKAKPGEKISCTPASDTATVSGADSPVDAKRKTSLPATNVEDENSRKSPLQSKSPVKRSRKTPVVKTIGKTKAAGKTGELPKKPNKTSPKKNTGKPAAAAATKNTASFKELPKRNGTIIVNPLINSQQLHDRSANCPINSSKENTSKGLSQKSFTIKSTSIKRSPTTKAKASTKQITSASSKTIQAVPDPEESNAAASDIAETTLVTEEIAASSSSVDGTSSNVPASSAAVETATSKDILLDCFARSRQEIHEEATLCQGTEPTASKPQKELQTLSRGNSVNTQSNDQPLSSTNQHQLQQQTTSPAKPVLDTSIPSKAEPQPATCHLYQPPELPKISLIPLSRLINNQFWQIPNIDTDLAAEETTLQRHLVPPSPTPLRHIYKPNLIKRKRNISTCSNTSTHSNTTPAPAIDPIIAKLLTMNKLIIKNIINKSGTKYDEALKLQAHKRVRDEIQRHLRTFDYQQTTQCQSTEIDNFVADEVVDAIDIPDFLLEEIQRVLSSSSAKDSSKQSLDKIFPQSLQNSSAEEAHKLQLTNKLLPQLTATSKDFDEIVQLFTPTENKQNNSEDIRVSQLLESSENKQPNLLEKTLTLSEATQNKHSADQIPEFYLSPDNRQNYNVDEAAGDKHINSHRDEDSQFLEYIENCQNNIADKMVNLNHRNPPTSQTSERRNSQLSSPSSDTMPATIAVKQEATKELEVAEQNSHKVMKDRRKIKKARKELHKKKSKSDKAARDIIVLDSSTSGESSTSSSSSSSSSSSTGTSSQSSSSSSDSESDISKRSSGSSIKRQRLRLKVEGENVIDNFEKLVLPSLSVRLRERYRVKHSQSNHLKLHFIACICASDYNSEKFTKMEIAKVQHNLKSPNCSMALEFLTREICNVYKKQKELAKNASSCQLLAANKQQQSDGAEVDQRQALAQSSSPPTATSTAATMLENSGRIAKVEDTNALQQCVPKVMTRCREEMKAAVQSPPVATSPLGQTSASNSAQPSASLSTSFGLKVPQDLGSTAHMLFNGDQSHKADPSFMSANRINLTPNDAESQLNHLRPLTNISSSDYCLMPIEPSSVRFNPGIFNFPSSSYAQPPAFPAIDLDTLKKQSPIGEAIVNSLREIDVQLVELHKRKMYIEEMILKLQKDKMDTDLLAIKLQNEKFILLNTAMTANVTNSSDMANGKPPVAPPQADSPILIENIKAETVEIPDDDEETQVPSTPGISTAATASAAAAAATLTPPVSLASVSPAPRTVSRVSQIDSPTPSLCSVTKDHDKEHTSRSKSSCSSDKITSSSSRAKRKASPPESYRARQSSKRPKEASSKRASSKSRHKEHRSSKSITSQTNNSQTESQQPQSPQSSEKRSKDNASAKTHALSSITSSKNGRCSPEPNGYERPDKKSKDNESARTHAMSNITSSKNGRYSPEPNGYERSDKRSKDNESAKTHAMSSITSSKNSRCSPEPNGYERPDKPATPGRSHEQPMPSTSNGAKTPESPGHKDVFSEDGQISDKAENNQEFRDLPVGLVSNVPSPVSQVSIYNSWILAASETGKIFMYDAMTMELIGTYNKHTEAITQMIVYGQEGYLFSTSLDGYLKKSQLKNLSNGTRSAYLKEPLQTMDINWNSVFVGSRWGKIYTCTDMANISSTNLLCATESSIITIKAVKEGSRNVLIVSSKGNLIHVRDASSGLLLRTFDVPDCINVYSILLDEGILYCGTQRKEIRKYDFVSGAPHGSITCGNGAISLVMFRSKYMIVGCYDGYIYILDKETGLQVSRLAGSGKMILALEIVGNKIITSAKDSSMKVVNIPSFCLGPML